MQKCWQNIRLDYSDEVRDEAEKYLKKGSTVIYIAADGALIGYIVLSDTIRSESGQMISDLISLGVCAGSFDRGP